MNTNMNVCTRMDDGSKIKSIRIAHNGGVFVELVDGRVWYAPKESVPMLRDLLEEGGVHDRSPKEMVPARHSEEEQDAGLRIRKHGNVILVGRYIALI